MESTRLLSCDSAQRLGSDKDTKPVLALEVSNAANTPIVLPHFLKQLNTKPNSVGKLGFAPETKCPNGSKRVTPRSEIPDDNTHRFPQLQCAQRTTVTIQELGRVYRGKIFGCSAG
eukprot:CAMPEP_0175819264 /NCGR_PEP_ID=MMETSP0107_2-20121207/7977_1 /TAXON_ID=195067 ORGANISM="Goniomonas pacifica, Strain CCMP1869" /NCGR_SAMPLE_ID=MMETSP0107_2 /ASSEMBLY_ACC=CAM_ASM_000203 /LENGTH=115 /DNA_ID=CAMNT_0017131501 /DNA_START=236 /DNA_END=583 /DNA_ORIENTATION=+